MYIDEGDYDDNDFISHIWVKIELPTSSEFNILLKKESYQNAIEYITKWIENCYDYLGNGIDFKAQGDIIEVMFDIETHDEEDGGTGADLWANDIIKGMVKEFSENDDTKRYKVLNYTVKTDY